MFTTVRSSHNPYNVQFVFAVFFLLISVVCRIPFKYESQLKSWRKKVEIQSPTYVYSLTHIQTIQSNWKIWFSIVNIEFFRSFHSKYDFRMAFRIRNCCWLLVILHSSQSGVCTFTHFIALKKKYNNRPYSTLHRTFSIDYWILKIKWCTLMCFYSISLSLFCTYFFTFGRHHFIVDKSNRIQ